MSINRDTSAPYGVETWNERPISIYLGTGGGAPAALADRNALLSTYVTVPNLGFSALMQTLAAPPFNVPSFEAVANPLFTSIGAPVLATTALEVADLLLTPVGLNVVVMQSIIIYSSAFAMAPPAALAALAADWDNATSVTVLPPSSVPLLAYKLMSLPVPMDVNVAVALLTPGLDGYGFLPSPFSLLQSSGWLPIAAAITAGTQAAELALVAQWISAFNSTDPRYLSPYPLGFEIAASHVGAVLEFVAQSDAAALVAAGGQLHGVGLVPSGLPTDFGAAQLAGNAATGYNAWVATGELAPLASLAGYTLANSCPAGTSMADLPGSGLSPLAPPEMSCWSARVGSTFGARLNVSQMNALLGAVTTGPSVVGLPAPAGAAAAAALFTGAYQMLTLLATNPGALDPAVALFLGGVRAQYQSYLAAVAAGDAVAAAAAVASHAALMASSASCPYDLAQIGLNCAQVADVAGWLNYFAKYTFETEFVNVGPRVYNSTLGQFVAHPEAPYTGLANEATPMRAGPLLRCTLLEITGACARVVVWS